MYLFYLDESGHSIDTAQKHFVLAGFSIFERQGFWFEQQLDQIARRFNPADPKTIELHGCPIFQGRGFWRKIPLKDRIDAISDALSVLANSHIQNRVFCSVVDKSCIAGADPVEYCFEQVISRFDYFLRRCFLNGDPQRGLLIFDKSTYEKTLQSLAINFRSSGHSWGKLQNIAEVPLFLDSTASRLIQLADLVAYSAFRHFERGDSRFYNIIQNRFDADGGIVHGLYVRN